MTLTRINGHLNGQKTTRNALNRYFSVQVFAILVTIYKLSDTHIKLNPHFDAGICPLDVSLLRTYSMKRAFVLSVPSFRVKKGV